MEGKLVKKKKLVYGVGLNDSDKPISWSEVVDGKRKVHVLPIYKTWQHMIERVHSEKFKSRRTSYDQVLICEEWYTFSNFERWMSCQDWQGKQLDKDILSSDEVKIYSPDTCAFILPIVNSFFKSHESSGSVGLKGVYTPEKSSGYVSMCSNPFTKKVDHLGTFQNKEDAHLAYKKRRYEHAVKLIEDGYVNDSRVEIALLERYVYE
jgi:hypothetical protein